MNYLSINNSILDNNGKKISGDINNLLNEIFSMQLPHNYPQYLLSNISEEDIEQVYCYSLQLYKDKYYDEAKILLMFLSRLNHKHFGVMLGLGLCCKQLKQYIEAIPYFYSANQLSLLDPRPYYFIAEIMEDLNQTDYAYIMYDLSYKLSFSNPSAFLYKKSSEDGRDRTNKKRC